MIQTPAKATRTATLFHSAPLFRSAAKWAGIILVDLLEQLRLVEVGSVLEVLDQLRLAAVEDLDLEVGAGLAVFGQVLEAAPGAFQLLELRRMQDRKSTRLNSSH